jgi:hypothetical protein
VIPNSMLRRALYALCPVPLSLFTVTVGVAVAAPHHPTEEFARFSDCPLDRSTINDCTYAAMSSGSVTIGRKAAPITNPVILQGGFEGAGSEIQFYGAEDGQTMSRTREAVPGGFFAGFGPNTRGTELWATLELAGPATRIKLSTENLIFEEGVAIALPVKVHLEGSLLGDSCYLGSDARPILLHLSTAVSGRLKGHAGELTFGNELFTLSELHGTRLVDGAFAVPRATGCGETSGFAVDRLVNSFLGTPLAPGESAIVLEGDFWDGAASAVIESS